MADKQANEEKHLNILLFSADYDKCLAAFILANGARDMGMQVTIFCAFWGLLILREEHKVSPKNKDLYKKIFAAMTPANVEDLPLSKMNFAGVGKSMLVSMMDNQDAPHLSDFLRGARNKGVRFCACKLSMEIMGFTEEELISDIEVADVKIYLEDAAKADISLFI
ncbi:DsrE/DsrF/DrsH-like family protein [Syntrophomonas palmitatica]|uniref:DsrE/DsrF/DrsH-like family protein n=1 Tax=Syntrophomonas palmitatica TaxID=402877 RepID=UPI0006D056D2|nr:DsrE/DsrF/DrsH-like family protein [Syntrophomonas palmitatica]